MGVNNLWKNPRDIIGKPEANAILQPHYQRLIGCVEAGRDHYRRFEMELLGPLKRRTKAGILNDAVVADAKRRFDGSKNVSIDDEHDGCFLVFDNRLALRFKLLDKHDATRNVRTTRQKCVSFHRRQTLPGFESLDFVTLGYRLDDLFYEVTEMKIVCWFGDRKLWRIGLGAADESLLYSAEEVLAAESESAPTVRSKGTAKKARRTDGRA